VAFFSLVGVAGFEPTTSSSRTKRATGLRYTPNGSGALAGFRRQNYKTFSGIKKVLVAFLHAASRPHPPAPRPPFSQTCPPARLEMAARSAGVFQTGHQAQGCYADDRVPGARLTSADVADSWRVQVHQFSPTGRLMHPLLTQGDQEGIDALVLLERP
jgi:hypothetical protein